MLMSYYSWDYDSPPKKQLLRIGSGSKQQPQLPIDGTYPRSDNNIVLASRAPFCAGGHSKRYAGDG